MTSIRYTRATETTRIKLDAEQVRKALTAFLSNVDTVPPDAEFEFEWSETNGPTGAVEISWTTTTEDSDELP